MPVSAPGAAEESRDARSASRGPRHLGARSSRPYRYTRNWGGRNPIRVTTGVWFVDVGILTFVVRAGEKSLGALTTRMISVPNALASGEVVQYLVDVVLRTLACFSLTT